jgi:hypothetical protein
MSEYFFIRGSENPKRRGTISDSFVEKAFGYYERKGAPFLENRRKVKHRIYLDQCNTLHLGKPPNSFPEIPTWRQFLKKYEGYSELDLRTRLDEISYNLTWADLNDELGCEFFLDQWAHNYSPAAEFAHLIDDLRVGVEDAKTDEVLGSLTRYEGNFTGSDVLCMTLEEPTTLSWLQWAMDKVGEPANIYYL